mgnify:CR=1 FL=1
MKWKWWHSSILCFFFGCGQSIQPELKEDLSIKERVIQIDSETWSDLEGHWRAIRKHNGHWAADLPCEGEGSSLFFSKRGSSYVLTRIKDEKILIEESLHLLEREDERIVLEGETQKIDFRLKDSIIHFQNELYTVIDDNSLVERIYQDPNTCLGEVSLKGTTGLLGTWYDAPCGSIVLQINETEIIYREEPSEIVWIQPQGDNFWLSLKKANKIYGAFFELKESSLLLKNGRYDEWKSVDLHKKSKDCETKR